MISKRARSIILEILKKDEVKIQELSNRFHVSERTIRSDLEEIDFFLKEHGCNAIERKNRGMVSIAGDDAVSMLVYQLINEHKIVITSYSPQERLLEIFYLLAVSDAPLKLEDLAECLFVSKSTVVKDLETLKLLYEEFDLCFLGTHEADRTSGQGRDHSKTVGKTFYTDHGQKRGHGYDQSDCL